MATKARSKKASGRKSSSSNGNVSLRELSSAERRKLASQIKALRKDKVPWDGDDGICDQLGLSSALQGRALLREFGGDSLIRDREVAPATKKKGKAKPKPKGRRRAADDDDDDDAPAPRRRKKVAVKRGRGKSRNPS